MPLERWGFFTRSWIPTAPTTTALYEVTRLHEQVYLVAFLELQHWRLKNSHYYILIPKQLAVQVMLPNLTQYCMNVSKCWNIQIPPFVAGQTSQEVNQKTIIDEDLAYCAITSKITLGSRQSVARPDAAVHVVPNRLTVNLECSYFRSTGKKKKKEREYTRGGGALLLKQRQV